MEDLTKEFNYIFTLTVDFFIERKHFIENIGHLERVPKSITKDEIKRALKELEFADLTCTMGFIGLNLRRPRWVINDEELIKKAKEYNKRR